MNREMQVDWVRPERLDHLECLDLQALAVLPALREQVALPASAVRPAYRGQPDYLELQAPPDSRAQPGRRDPQD